MKSVFLFSFLALILFSCNNDDMKLDEVVIPPDPCDEIVEAPYLIGDYRGRYIRTYNGNIVGNKIINVHVDTGFLHSDPGQVYYKEIEGDFRNNISILSYYEYPDTGSFSAFYFNSSLSLPRQIGLDYDCKKDSLIIKELDSSPGYQLNIKVAFKGKRMK